MKTSASSTEENTEASTSSAGASPAKAYPWQESVRASLMNAAVSSLKCVEWWAKQSPTSLSGRMFPDCSVVTGERTSRPSSGHWPTSGIMELGGCWTVNSSEWPSGGDGSLVCSLAEILDGEVPQRFYLSPKAAAGILRRAEKRGRTLPRALHEALQAVRDNGKSPVRRRTYPNGATPSLRNGQDADGLQSRNIHLSSATPSEKTYEASGRGTTRTSCRRRKAVLYKLQENRADPVLATNATGGDRALWVSTLTSEENSEQADLQEASRVNEAQSNSRVLRVRRLTPLECERLQGFPEGWTLPDTVPSETP